MMEKLSTEYDYIAENVKYIREGIARAAQQAGRNPEEVRLMAVTKTVPASKVNAAIACGVTLLGENRAQELTAKYTDYEKEGVDLHFIGHLQTNKVRQIVDKVSMIHSVDSYRLAAEIDRQAGKLNKVMEILLEVNIGGEQSKSGVLPEQVEELAYQIDELRHVTLRGLMAIPPICDDLVRLEQYFSDMRQLSVDIRAKKLDNGTIDILSMGMSGDYEPAVRHGSNIVRVGTALFGERHYGTR